MISSLKKNNSSKELAYPGITDVASIELRDAVHRCYPAPPIQPEKAAQLNNVFLAGTLFAALILGYFFTPLSSMTASSRWDEQPVISSVYVAVKSPSSQFINKLSQLASRGVDVRIVSGQPLTITGAKIGIVAPEKIQQDYVMVNGLTIYPLQSGQD